MDYMEGHLNMHLEFENILNVEKELVEQVRNWRNSTEVNQYMHINHQISEEEHQNWIENLKNKNDSKAWIIIYKKKPVGLIQLSDIDYINKTAQWGFYIADETTRGKGVGSASLYKLMKYVFDEMNFNRMHTKVLKNNHVAIKLYEKFGFKKEGLLKQQLMRDGKYIDVILMGMLQEEWINMKEKLKVTIEN